MNQKSGPGGDRWYVCMPMFHGTGGLTIIGCMMGGLSAAIGRKFSVSTFWDDIHDSDATIFVYVGEACRYLLNAPPHPYERDHPRLRLMYGNGLRPDVWERFRTRFNVPEIAEFFNSTEGLFQLAVWNKGPFTRNAVGHQGAFLRRMFEKVYVPVLIDTETGDIYRDPETGFAKRTHYHIGGEIIVAIPSERAFTGYFNDNFATSRKILRDVFRKGDIYYRTGDVLRRDNDGRWFFVDRLGDTFRWKSENVSTAEVAEHLGTYPGVDEANVYGVLVPGHDGRAGCVALSLSGDAGNFDVDGFLLHARKHLPKYAVPVFVRLVAARSSTDNNKQNKVPLRDEGIDVSKFGSKVVGGQNDALLWLAPGGSGYVAFDKGYLDALRSGEVVL
jgi:acyl-CoA synthetase (AMP-forming)/AMP-acid ligase II